MNVLEAFGLEYGPLAPHNWYEDLRDAWRDSDLHDWKIMLAIRRVQPDVFVRFFAKWVRQTADLYNTPSLQAISDDVDAWATTVRSQTKGEWIGEWTCDGKAWDREDPRLGNFVTESGYDYAAVACQEIRDVWDGLVNLISHDFNCTDAFLEFDRCVYGLYDVWQHVGKTDDLDKLILESFSIDEIDAEIKKRHDSVLHDPNDASDVARVFFDYLSAEGPVACHVLPVRQYFGVLAPDPETQWLQEAYDYDAKANRSFAMKRIRYWGRDHDKR